MTIAATSASTSAASGTATAAKTSDPLASLSSNLNNFLTLLMTQLKNHDPSSPMDTNQFTSQLVQFASVEQQVNISSGVQSLIQLTQANGVLQASSLLGKTVTATSSQLSLQNGSGSIRFNAPAAEPVTISVLGINGTPVQQVSLTSSAGQNDWTWDGTGSKGQKMPDGAYTVSVSGGTAGTKAAAIPFTVTGVATGVVNQNGTEQVQLGGLTLPFTAIRSVGN